MKRSLGAKSLVYPTPVFVTGSYDKKGEPNLMTDPFHPSTSPATLFKKHQSQQIE